MRAVARFLGDPMQSTLANRPAIVGEKVLAASRQVWLAGLGAAVVTRDWAGKEAGQVFRGLVREGTAVESRAIRFVGDRVETSVVRANRMLRQARSTLQFAVKDYAGGAITLVRESLPVSLPRIDLTGMLRKSKKPAPAKRQAAKRRVKTAKVVKTAKRAKRTGR